MGFRNYRIVMCDTEHGPILTIGEAYYESFDSNFPQSIEYDPDSNLTGDSIEELKEELQMMMRALDEPIIRMDSSKDECDTNSQN